MNSPTNTACGVYASSPAFHAQSPITTNEGASTSIQPTLFGADHPQERVRNMPYPAFTK